MIKYFKGKGLTFGWVVWLKNAFALVPSVTIITTLRCSNLYLYEQQTMPINRIANYWIMEWTNIAYFDQVFLGQIINEPFILHFP